MKYHDNKKYRNIIVQIECPIQALFKHNQNIQEIYINANLDKV